MSRVLIVLLFCFLNSVNSQTVERNYHFDNYKIISYKNFRYKYDYKYFSFKNSKDSTYNLEIGYSDNNKRKSCFLRDWERKELIRFDIDFVFMNKDDLAKLKNPAFVKIPSKTSNYSVFNKRYEKIEFEKDSINNKTIVHLIRFKDGSLKKILHDEYYFFGINKEINSKDLYSMKNYFNNSYNIGIPQDEDLEKILRLKDGKIESQTDYIKIVNIDYNPNLKIEK